MSSSTPVILSSGLTRVHTADVLTQGTRTSMWFTTQCYYSSSPQWAKNTNKRRGRALHHVTNAGELWCGASTTAKAVKAFFGPLNFCTCMCKMLVSALVIILTLVTVLNLHLIFCIFLSIPLSCLKTPLPENLNQHNKSSPNIASPLVTCKILFHLLWICSLT